MWILGAAVAPLSPAAASGVEVYIPTVQARSGEALSVPVMINHTDNLAGVKLVLQYDPALLTFRSGAKTAHTSELMHVVNDKTPGRLIIVMAGARGIKGTDIPLFTISFTAAANVAEETTTRIEITENQLMSDQLNVIACRIRTEPVTITP